MLKVLAGLGVLLALWIGAGFAVVAAAGPFQPSGRFVDIGGRKLRLVCAGPPKSDNPTIWMEAGAWGLAADFAAVQQKLTGKGLRSCAYDRAGMGFSDPGPRPRDSQHIVEDLEKLIAASGEQGPFILMAHSMAGQHMRLFATRNPEKVAGLVLIEAVTPEMTQNPQAERFLGRVRMVARASAVANTLGLSRAVYSKGDKIGLPPQGSAEKKHAFVSGRHARNAAAEVVVWREGSNQAAGKPLDPQWPVAVITAGDENRLGEWNVARRAPERASRAGYFENEPRAEHASVLGLKYNDVVIHGVDHVLAALKAAPSPEAMSSSD